MRQLCRDLRTLCFIACITITSSDNLGSKRSTAALCNLAIWGIESFRKHMAKVMNNNPKFRMRSPKHIADIAEGAKHVLQLGHCTGEGWFLTGEMIELINSGVRILLVFSRLLACLTTLQVRV